MITSEPGGARVPADPERLAEAAGAVTPPKPTTPPPPSPAPGDGCGCRFDAAGRRFRSRCICAPPMTPEQILRTTAQLGVGNPIGDAVAGLLAQHDAALAALDAWRSGAHDLAGSHAALIRISEALGVTDAG